MPGINMESILKKAQAYVDSQSFQDKISKKIDEAVLNGTSYQFGSRKGDAYGAASKFIEVMKATIESLGGSSGESILGPTAISAASNLEYVDPVKIGQNKYMIGIYFVGDLHRESLDPSKYSGVDNIVALLNNGYSAKGAVRGVWSGHTTEPIWSRVNFGGAHFIEQAVKDFLGNYESEYGVLDLEVDDKYLS